MATSKNDAIEKKKCVTHEFRVSFPAVFEPKAFEGNAAKYSMVMLFDKKTDLKAPANGQANSLMRIVRNAAIEKWGPKEKWPKKLKLPFRDGDERSDTPGYEDTIFCTAVSSTQPGLIDAKKRPILSESDFYAGCYARAEVIAFAYDTAGNRGVSLALQNIQKLRDGEPFAGKRNPNDVFDAVESDDDDDTDDDELDDDDDMLS